MEKEQINQLLDKQRQYFYSGATFDLDFRISALKRLRASIRKYEDQIHAALKKDLGKSNFESYMCETGLVLSEITHMLKNIRFQIAMGKKVLYKHSHPETKCLLTGNK